jgi:hypothetical protein
MPEVTKTPEVKETVTETKTQPWRTVWPASEEAECPQMERRGSQGGSGAFGYNDKGEGITPKK